MSIVTTRVVSAVTEEPSLSRTKRGSDEEDIPEGITS